MTIQYDLANQTTAVTGTPAGYLDWKFFVRIAKPQYGSAVLGSMVLGTDVLADLVWYDVTPDFAGANLQRGIMQANGRPGAGTLNLRLEGSNYSPATNIYHGAGTLVQIGLYLPSNAPQKMFPLWTGITTRWSQLQEAFGYRKYVDIEALETLAFLSDANLAAVNPVGDNEQAGARFNRILANAEFAFGLQTVGALPTFGLQATTLAADALSSLYLTADSVTVPVTTAKNGDVRVLATFVEQGYSQFLNTNVSVYPEVFYRIGMEVPYVADSVREVSDDDLILSSVSMARAGDDAAGRSAVPYQTTYPIPGRYSQRSTQRYYLITKYNGSNMDLERHATDLLGRSRTAYRIEGATLDTNHGGQVWKFLAALDIYNVVSVRKPDVEVQHGIKTPSANGTDFLVASVAGYTMDIAPQSPNKSIRIVTEVAITPSALTYIARY